MTASTVTTRSTMLSREAGTADGFAVLRTSRTRSRPDMSAPPHSSCAKLAQRREGSLSLLARNAAMAATCRLLPALEDLQVAELLHHLAGHGFDRVGDRNGEHVLVRVG